MVQLSNQNELLTQLFETKGKRKRELSSMIQSVFTLINSGLQLFFAPENSKPRSEKR